MVISFPPISFFAASPTSKGSVESSCFLLLIFQLMEGRDKFPSILKCPFCIQSLS